jgi:hypothetical protein
LRRDAVPVLRIGTAENKWAKSPGRTSCAKRAAA